SVAGNDTASGDGGNVWALATGAGNGTATVAANGAFTYTPNANFFGTDTFTYTLTDADGDVSSATVTVTVNSVDDLPVAVDDAVATNEDTPLAGSVAGNDTASGDGGNVWALATGAGNGTATVAANGAFTYTPNANFFGTDTFTYTLTDADGDVSSATVTVTVNSVNDAPTAVNDAAAVQEDVTLSASGNLLTNDTDPDVGDTKLVTRVNGAAGNVGIAVAGTYGSVTLNIDGSYTYTLNNAAAIVQQLRAGQTVTDTFSYQMADGSAATASANLVVTLTGSNDLPVANDDTTAVQGEVTLAAAGRVL